MKRHLYGLLLAGIVAIFGVDGAKSQDGPIAIGTLPQGSLGYTIASAVAKVTSEKTGLQIRAVGQGGSSVYLPQVEKGEMAFGTSNTFEAIFATTGTGNFKGLPNPNLRVAALLVPFQVGIMVAKDSNIHAVTDLKGKPFPVDYARQKLVAVMQNAIFNAVGMSESDIDGVPVPNFVEGASLLAQGKVAGVLLAPGSGVVKKTHASRPIRFITVPSSPEVEAAIKKSLPGSALVLVKPNKRLPSIAEPVHLVGYQYALMTNAGASDDMVYKVVKAVHENKDGLAAAHGIFRRFDPAKMAAKLEGATFHPGAIRYYKEVGIWPGK